MTGWLRRNWIPTAGMAAAVAFVAWLGWINLRGGSGTGVGAPTGAPRVSASATASVSPSTTADPAVAEVEAAAKAWVHAYFDSYLTADSSKLDAMAVPDSQASGVAGTPRAFVLTLHEAYLVSQISYDPFLPVVVGDVATADVGYTTVAVMVDYPSLKPKGGSESKHWNDHFTFTRTNGQWLVTSFT